MSTLPAARLRLHPVDVNKSVNYGYTPLLRGNYAADFNLPLHQAIANNLQGNLLREHTITLQDLLDYQQPLVLAFFPKDLNDTARLAYLESLQADIQVMGGKLLILTHTPSARFPARTRQQLKLNIFYDQDNYIADLFGLYDHSNPLWQWISGVEEAELSLPAFYVISPGKEIIHHYIDYDFNLYKQAGFSSDKYKRSLLTAVYQASRQYTPANNYAAYKSVS